MIIYFKGTRDIFGINLREKGISLLSKGTLVKNLGNKGENDKFSRDQGNMHSPLGGLNPGMSSLNTWLPLPGLRLFTLGRRE